MSSSERDRLSCTTDGGAGGKLKAQLGRDHFAQGPPVWLLRVSTYWMARKPLPALAQPLPNTFDLDPQRKAEGAAGRPGTGRRVEEPTGKVSGFELPLQQWRILHRIHTPHPVSAGLPA